MRSLSFNFSIAFRMFSWNESTPAPDPVLAVAPDPEAVDAAGAGLLPAPIPAKSSAFSVPFMPSMSIASQAALNASVLALEKLGGTKV